MHHAYYTPMAGGLGDILMYYSEGDLGYFKALKEGRLDGKTTTTKVITYSVSDQVRALFEHHPHVDIKDHRDFAEGLRKMSLEEFAVQHGDAGFHSITNYVRSNLTKESPPFYLDPDETMFADQFMAAGPYIAVHPFAGSPNRELRGRVDIWDVLSKLCDQHRVVLLGGDSYRQDQDRKMVERLALPFHTNLFNITNMFSVRLHAHLTAKAAKFIGTASAYNCVAHQHKVPTQLWTDANNRRLIATEKNGIFAMVRDQGTECRYFDLMPTDPAADMVAFANR